MYSTKNLVRMREATRRTFVVWLLSLTVFLPGITGESQAQQSSPPQQQATQQSEDENRVHDPSMIKQGKTYYVFSTGSPNGQIKAGNIQIRRSTDLANWRFHSTVFKEIPAWITDTLGKQPKSLWAPDISFFNGKYHLYYSASFFGTNNSLVALATNRTLDPESPDYKWIDQGIVIRTTTADDWNAIDPHLIIDRAGKAWLSLGSFWSGIKMRRINERTGKLHATDTTLYSLAGRPTPTGGGPIEAPAILYRAGYYHLIVSFDFCCRGLKSTYKIAAGRAKNITGPYLDKAGKRMTEGGGDILLAGDDGRRSGLGGQSVFSEPNTDWLVYHFYDRLDDGKPKIAVNKIGTTNDAWLTLTPRH